MSLISKEKGDSLDGIFYLTKDILVYQNGKKLFLEYKDFKTEVELPKGELFFDLIKNDDKIYLFLVKESTNEIMDFVLIQFDEKLEKISTKEFFFKSSNFIDGQVGSVHEGAFVLFNYVCKVLAVALTSALSRRYLPDIPLRLVMGHFDQILSCCFVAAASFVIT